MNLLIVGASGRIGRMLEDHLERRRPEGVSVRLLSRAAAWASDPDAFCARHSWPKSPGEAGDSFEWAETVVNLAGLTPTAGAQAPDAAEFAAANVDLTLEVIARSRNARRILLASSAAVYGAPAVGQTLFDESDMTNPVNAYGVSKQQMETAVSALDDPRLCAVRIATVAGADQLIQNALRSRAADPLKLDRFASGSGPVRSYIGPDSLAAGFLSLCLAPARLPPVINLAHPAAVPMEDLLRALSEQGVPIHWQMQEARPGAIETVLLATSRLEAIHSFADSGDPVAALARETVDYLRRSGDL